MFSLELNIASGGNCIIVSLALVDDGSVSPEREFFSLGVLPGSG